MSWTRHRIALLAFGVGILAAAGCGGGGPTVDAELRLVVPDNHIRAPEDECAGARPYQHVHAGARFTIEAADGTVLAEGELPPGRATSADPEIDWDLDRIPTVCVVELSVEGLPERPGYQLRLTEGSPLEFGPEPLADGEPVVLVVH